MGDLGHDEMPCISLRCMIGESSYLVKLAVDALYLLLLLVQLCEGCCLDFFSLLHHLKRKGLGSWFLLACTDDDLCHQILHAA